jgi:DNA-binding CsgD family transcriptional regulator
MADPDNVRAPGRTDPEGEVLAAFGLLRQLLSATDDQLAQARDALGDLAHVIPQSDVEVPAATQVLVVLNPAHVRERVNRCIEQAVQDFAFINQGPLVLDRLREHEIEDALIARGVRVRGLYEQSAIDGPGALDDLLWSLAAGEEARATLTTPARWVMIDQEVVFTTARSGGNFHEGIIEVRQPALVALFAAYYELMWTTAVPLADFREGPAAEAFDAEDRALASLLATGMNDKAIARQLGVSERTAHRRVVGLMSRLGAESRFQAGVQAARNGLMG